LIALISIYDVKARFIDMKNTNPKDLLNQTIKRMDGAYADSTTRAYRVDFEHFIKYCQELNESPLPATPETICLYIKSLIQDGRSSARIRRVMAGMTTIKTNASKNWALSKTSFWSYRGNIKEVATCN
jgi:site-specific recombinase XerD